MKPQKRNHQRGFTLIEILVALVVLMVGLMGSAGIMVRSVQQEVESYQRLQALNLIQDITDRIYANPAAAACYSNVAAGENYGTGADALAACNLATASDEEKDRADQDMAAWDDLLNGSSKIQSAGGPTTGAMIGARGCIIQVSANVLNKPDTYRITVAWQGLSDTTAPTAANTCGLGAYGDATKRRIVNAVVGVTTP